VIKDVEVAVLSICCLPLTIILAASGEETFALLSLIALFDRIVYLALAALRIRFEALWP
jgi:hypothetical protein